LAIKVLLMEGAENLNRFAMHSLRELNDLAVARRQILAAPE